MIDGSSDKSVMFQALENALCAGSVLLALVTHKGWMKTMVHGRNVSCVFLFICLVIKACPCMGTCV